MKQNVMKHLLFIIIALVFTSCGVTSFNVYTFNLTEVQKPCLADQAQDDRVVITDLQQDKEGRYTFEDEYIKITWEPGNKQFRLWLTNKSVNSIQIPWDNAGYVDYTGNVGRVIHSGAKNPNDLQPPITIPGGTILSDVLIPADKWYSVIIPTKEVNAWIRSGLTKVQAANPVYIGKSIAFLLPIIIRGVQNDYLFTFDIGQKAVNAGDIEF